MITTKNIVSCACAISFLALQGCVSGPKQKTTVAERLNGENYNKSDVVMGIPVLERKLIHRKISGKVYCGEGLARVPANHARVELVGGTETVATTSTDIEGRFLISAVIKENLGYRLSGSAKCGKSFAQLPLALESDINSFDLTLKK